MPSLPRGLGLVQGMIRDAEERFDRLAVPRVLGHAHTQRQGRLLRVHRQVVPDAARHLPSRGFSRLGHHEGKLVAAEPGHGVHGAA